MPASFEAHGHSCYLSFAPSGDVVPVNSMLGCVLAFFMRPSSPTAGGEYQRYSCVPVLGNRIHTGVNPPNRRAC